MQNHTPTASLTHTHTITISSAISALLFRLSSVLLATSSSRWRGRASSCQALKPTAHRSDGFFTVPVDTMHVKERDQHEQTHGKCEQGAARDLRGARVRR